MAQSFATTNGTLIIPGAYSTVTVATTNSGLATTGVLMLMGEADAGPDFTLETDLSTNFFGPGDMDLLTAKYASGPLVDAARAAANPANDPNIQGSPAGFIICKTNPSVKASLALLDSNGVAYATIADQSYGSLGSQLNLTIVNSTLEVKPTTGPFTLLVPIGTVAYGIRVNGAASVSGGTLAAGSLPTAVVSALNALIGVAATGGTNRSLIPSVVGTLALAVNSGNAVTVSYVGTLGTAAVGDTLFIPVGSVLSGAANANCGSYVVTGLGTNALSATKLMNASGAIAGLTAPVAVSATNVVATTDLQGFAPVVITGSASAIINGTGKTLAIDALATGTDLLTNCCYSLNTSKVAFISTAAVPTVIVSASEAAVTLTVQRAVDAVTETITAGGPVALSVGATATTATIQVTPNSIIGTATGGTGVASFTILLSQYATVAAIAQYINSLAGWSASLPTANQGFLPSLALDENTYNCGSTLGEQTARIKADGYRLFQALSTQSTHVQLGVPAIAPSSGLPGPLTLSFLAGGARGGTTDAIIANALVALQSVQGNFLVPLFSQDAAKDILNGATDLTSTYHVLATHLACSQHATAMSVLKKRRNRQAFLSIEDSFVNAQTAAANVANYRCTMNFQDVKTLNAAGALVQFQPWMGAAVAAGMQAAAFYKGIVHKYANVSGVISLAGDFSDQNDAQMETALTAGLLPMRRSPTGGVYFVSDQTTYGKDSNFVYNSVQAVYASDIIAITTAQRMENAFTGQSLADISASLALAFMQAVMADFLRLKLIAPSDDGAPKGYKNLNIRISGPAMVVSCEVKLASLNYFTTVNFLVSQVSQAAAA